MTNYFSHDIDAHKDPKCSALIAGHGMTGYGLYWCLIEILHEQDGRIEKFPKLYEGLAFALRIDVKQIEALVQALIHDYCLLKEDEKYIWSDRVLKNLKEREKKKIARQAAGRIGGQNSGKSRAKTKQNEALLQKNEANEPNKRKRKEIKVNKRETAETYLSNLPVDDVEEFTKAFTCSQSQVRSKALALLDWCRSNNEWKSDNKAFLRNALRKDFGDRVKVVQFDPLEVAPVQTEEERLKARLRIEQIKFKHQIKTI